MKNIMHKQRGFTLAELMITVAIASILLGVGLPSMRTFIQNGAVTSVTNELISTLSKAQNAAANPAIPNNSACVCPSTNAATATPSCAATSNWESGWIAFNDANADCVINGTDTLVRVWDGAPFAGEITVRTVSASINTSNRIIFNSGGQPLLADGTLQQGVFRVCDTRGLVVAGDESSTAAGVVMTPGGSVRSTRSAAQIVACP